MFFSILNWLLWNSLSRRWRRSPGSPVRRRPPVSALLRRPRTSAPAVAWRSMTGTCWRWETAWKKQKNSLTQRRKTEGEIQHEGSQRFNILQLRQLIISEALCLSLFLSSKMFYFFLQWSDILFDISSDLQASLFCFVYSLFPLQQIIF